MKEINGVQYITEKEASAKYGYSSSWFQKRRYNKLPPPFVKMEGKGKVLYPVVELDEWFKNNFIQYK